jgi:hypothetical protein
MNGSEENPYRSPVDSGDMAGAEWSPPGIDASRAVFMSGILTWSDCRRASRLILPNLPLICSFLWMGGVAGLLGVLIVFGGIDLTGMLLAVALEGLGALIAIALIAQRFVLAKQIWRMVGDNPMRRWVSDHAIRTDTPKSTITVAWSWYDRYTKRHDMLILRECSQAAFAVLPRSHCLSDAQWHALQAIIDDRLPIAPWGMMTR